MFDLDKAIKSVDRMERNYIRLQRFMFWVFLIGGFGFVYLAYVNFTDDYIVAFGANLFSAGLFFTSAMYQVASRMQFGHFKAQRTYMWTILHEQRKQGSDDI